jgi:hypothetical protein
MHTIQTLGFNYCYRWLLIKCRSYLVNYVLQASIFGFEDFWTNYGATLYYASKLLRKPFAPHYQAYSFGSQVLCRIRDTKNAASSHTSKQRLCLGYEPTRNKDSTSSPKIIWQVLNHMLGTPTTMVPTLHLQYWRTNVTLITNTREIYDGRLVDQVSHGNLGGGGVKIVNK